MVFEKIANFFNPDTTQQQRSQQLKQGQIIPQKQQQQQLQQQIQRQQQIKRPIQLPPLRQTSNLLQQQQQSKIPTQLSDVMLDQVQQKRPMQLQSLKKQQQQLQIADQLSDAILDQVKQQSKQSRQKLSQMQKQQISQSKLEQATKAHQQILSYVREVKELLNQIKETHYSQQKDRRVSKEQTDKILVKLMGILEQINAAKKQTKTQQKAQIQQLKQIAHEQSVKQMNKKSIQYHTPDGNKVRIQLAINPDTKCCVAQSLSKNAVMKIV